MFQSNFLRRFALVLCGLVVCSLVGGCSGSSPQDTFAFLYDDTPRWVVALLSILGTWAGKPLCMAAWKWLYRRCSRRPPEESRALYLMQARRRTWYYLEATLQKSSWRRYWYSWIYRNEHSVFQRLCECAESVRDLQTPANRAEWKQQRLNGELTPAKVLSPERNRKYQEKVLFVVCEQRLMKEAAERLPHTHQAALKELLTREAIAEAVYDLYRLYVDEDDDLRHDELAHASDIRDGGTRELLRVLTETATICEKNGEIFRSVPTRLDELKDRLEGSIAESACVLTCLDEMKDHLAKSATGSAGTLGDLGKQVTEHLEKIATAARNFRYWNYMAVVLFLITLVSLVGVMSYCNFRVR